MKLFYTDIFELPLPDKHRFPMSKYRLLRERIISEGLAVDDQAVDDQAGDDQAGDDNVQVENLQNANHVLIVPDAATDDQLVLAHDRKYVQNASEGLLELKEIKRIGFPWSDELIERSRRSTGATIGAARAAMVDGCSVNLAGGTHHAFFDCGEGYCVFNDSCVAARVLQKEGLISKALIVDCDVHQGNGTAAIVKNDPTIFCFSIHNQKNFPFRKMESDFDIGLADDVGDEEYLENLSAALEKISQQFTPDLVFYVSGADPFVDDSLGRLRLSKPGLKQRDEMVFRSFREENVPVAASMAGGYAKNVEDIVDIHFSTVQTAIRFSEK